MKGRKTDPGLIEEEFHILEFEKSEQKILIFN